MKYPGSICEASNALRAGHVKSRELLERSFAQVEKPSGEGKRVFRKTYDKAARAAADYYDCLHANQDATPPFFGIPISIKDNFNVTGDVTGAGSKLWSSRAPARTDALSVRRLKAAGFIPVGRTNMTEFAYSGLGLNPHFGTPLNPFRRDTGLISGGSTSGGAVAVADQMALASIGTDTGGSCRIPAAFCGLVGFKPTNGRIPIDGVIPLSPSLDCVGVLASSVECCAVLDGVLAANASALKPIDATSLRIGVPQSLVFDEIDDTVAMAFSDALIALESAGISICEVDARSLNDLPVINAKGGFAAAESYAYFRRLIEESPALFDPRVLSRMRRGAEQSAADYLDLLEAHRSFKAAFDEEVLLFDYILCPTTPIQAPCLSSLDCDSEYNRLNLLALRNPSIANMSGRPSISIPYRMNDNLPIGLMLTGKPGRDRFLLEAAKAIELILETHAGKGAR